MKVIAGLTSSVYHKMGRSRYDEGSALESPYGHYWRKPGKSSAYVNASIINDHTKMGERRPCMKCFQSDYTTRKTVVTRTENSEYYVRNLIWNL